MKLEKYEIQQKTFSDYLQNTNQFGSRTKLGNYLVDLGIRACEIIENTIAFIWLIVIYF
jgi:hypothetical protein